MEALHPDKMSEAEVSLRFAYGLLESKVVKGPVEIALDGAQIRTGESIHFPIVDFLTEMKWAPSSSSNDWRGMYYNQNYEFGLVIHSKSGKGDVVATLRDGRTLRIESKKGTLSRSKSSSEYPLIREALGQLLTVEEACETDVFAVAVPSSEKFESLAARWRQRPLLRRSGIHIATVDRNNIIRGLEDAGI